MEHNKFNQIFMPINFEFQKFSEIPSAINLGAAKGKKTNQYSTIFRARSFLLSIKAICILLYRFN